MQRSQLTRLVALTATTVLVSSTIQHVTALDAGDQILGIWDECALASDQISVQYMGGACGGNTMCQVGPMSDPTIYNVPYTPVQPHIRRCVPNSLSVLPPCHDIQLRWYQPNTGPYGCGDNNPNLYCADYWADIHTGTYAYNGQSFCVPFNTTAVQVAQAAQLATAANRSSVFQYATVDTYQKCELNKNCIQFTDKCYGFTVGLNVTHDSMAYNGVSGDDAHGFCSPSDLPQCDTNGNCPSGYQCGNAGEAAGMGVCFPTNDARVPASYFAATIMTAAPTTLAAVVPATVAPTTVPATTAPTVAPTTYIATAQPTVAATVAATATPVTTQPAIESATVTAAPTATIAPATTAIVSDVTTSPTTSPVTEQSTSSATKTTVTVQPSASIVTAAATQSAAAQPSTDSRPVTTTTNSKTQSSVAVNTQATLALIGVIGSLLFV